MNTSRLIGIRFYFKNPFVNYNFLLLIAFEFYLTEYKDEATFTMTRAGKFKLLQGGYEFTKMKSNLQGHTIWKCSQKSRLRCKGKAKTQQIDGREMVKLYDIHNHQPTNYRKWNLILNAIHVHELYVYLTTSKHAET